MKKYLFLIIATCISFTAISQYNPFFRFGIKAGANLSNVKGNDLKLGKGGDAFDFSDNDDRSLGFTGGIFMRFGRNFYIQPEFLVSQNGGTFNLYKDGFKNEDGKFDIRFTHFDVPVLIGGRIGRVFRINLGPMASFQLAESGKLGKSFDEYTGKYADVAYKDGVAWGYQMGVGIDLRRFNFDIRYEGNVNDIFDINYKSISAQEQFGRKRNLWQATVGFAIF